jgi:hypothetical protein
MAARDIAQQLACEIHIIDDEPLIALDVVELHVARTQCAAIAALADIQPADGSSRVDAVQEILRSIDISVIFTTAYPERLLTGKKPELSYLVAKTYRFDYPQAQCADQADTFFFYTRQRSGSTNYELLSQPAGLPTRPGSLGAKFDQLVTACCLSLR